MTKYRENELAGEKLVLVQFQSLAPWFLGLRNRTSQQSTLVNKVVCLMVSRKQKDRQREPKRKEARDKIYISGTVGPTSSNKAPLLKFPTPPRCPLSYEQSHDFVLLVRSESLAPAHLPKPHLQILLLRGPDTGALGDTSDPSHNR